MSDDAKQIGLCAFEVEVACSTYNITVDIVITEQGIEVHSELISWERIDAARVMLQKAGRKR